MNVNGNRLIDGLLTAGVVALCLGAIYPIHQLALRWLYIEPNPRHMPPDLTGEAVGWTIIGLLLATLVVVIAESVVWAGRRSFWERYKGLVIGSIISLLAGGTLGVAFAIIQMDSVDGQAMTSRELATLAGATAGTLGALAGIIAGTTLRRYLVRMYRMPESQPGNRLAFNNEDAAETAGPAAGRRSNAS